MLTLPNARAEKSLQRGESPSCYADTSLQCILQSIPLWCEAVQWINIDATLACYKMLENKSSLSFVVCDIVDCYPSINSDLLDQVLNWAARWCPISQDDRELFHHTKDSLLWHKGSTWVKRGEKNFDVAQGSYDGAKTTDLVGLLLLSKRRTCRWTMACTEITSLG